MVEAALFLGLVIMLIPIVGLALTMTGWIALKRRRGIVYPTEEERRLAVNEARTVLVVGLCFALPFPTIVLIAQLEKVLFP